MEHKPDARTNLEQLLVDETAEPKALPLSLLEDITDDFSDGQEIGSGGFAVVYKGILGDRVVAVKKLTDAFMDENNFHREVECLMRVKHNNVVRFLGYCADRQGRMETYEGKLVMADFHQRLLCFEYIRNGSLDKYIIDPHREWGMCYKIIKGICEGLQNLHDNRIVHLDLKPANILLDDNMAPKITDFGLSRCFNEKQSRDITKTILGTIGYMAPEFREGGIIARSADIYSLGVIIIEILTGQKGYKDTKDVLESWSGRLAISQQETLREQIRVCYKTALECIAFNPMKRPTSAQIIIDRLHQMESNQKENPDKGGGGSKQNNNLDNDDGRGNQRNLNEDGGGDRKKENASKGDEGGKPQKYPEKDRGGGEQKNKGDEPKNNTDKGVKGSEQKKNSDKGGEQKKKPEKEQKNNPDKAGGGGDQKRYTDEHVGDERKKNPDNEGRAQKIDKMGSQSQPKEDKEKKQPPEETDLPVRSVHKILPSSPSIRELTTMVLRIQLHCGNCAKKVRRCLRKLEGVHDVAVDISNHQVRVVGSLDVATVVRYLTKKMGKIVEVVRTSKKYFNDKGKEIDVAAASLAPGNKDDEKNKGVNSDGENKHKDKAAASGDVHKDIGERIEVNGPHRSMISAATPTPVGPAYYGSVAYRQPEAPPPSYYNYYGGNADSLQHANARSYYQSPNPHPYQPYPPPPYGFAPAPQMFSDENPNACHVM